MYVYYIKCTRLVSNYESNLHVTLNDLSIGMYINLASLPCNTLTTVKPGI